MSSEKVLYADQEHDAIRLAIPVIMVIGTVGGFVLLRAILPEGGFKTLGSCVGGLVLALLAAGVAEYGAKRFLPSAERFVVRDDGIELSRPGRATLNFQSSDFAMSTYWYFPLTDYPRGGRERRLPTHWICLACQLQQDEDRMNVYTFVAPRKARAYIDEYGFKQIYPKDVYDTSFRARMTLPTRPEIPPEVIAGKEGRLWLAERNRWHDGLQLSLADFATFLEATQTFATV